MEDHITSHFILVIMSCTIAQLSLSELYLRSASFIRLRIPKLFSLFFYYSRGNNGVFLTGAYTILIGQLLFYFLSHHIVQVNLTNKAYIFALFITVFYGYLDDRYTIRPRTKLLLQILTLSTYLLLSGTNDWAKNIVLFFLGIGILNGVNLTDGVDGLAAKISVVTLISFSVLFFLSNKVELAWTALSFIPMLFVFLFYNGSSSGRKFFLGEMGTGIIGILLFHFLYQGSVERKIIIDIRFIVPCLYFLVEVAISFIRRVVKGNAPFKGDRKHIHHILTQQSARSVQYITNSISFFYLLMLVGSSLFFEPIIPLIAVVLSLIIFQFTVGFKVWFYKPTEKFDDNLLHHPKLSIAKKEQNEAVRELHVTGPS